MYSLDIIPIEDDGITGNFEVTVEDELVHSYKTLGHNLAASQGERDVIVNAIKAAYEKRGIAVPPPDEEKLKAASRSSCCVIS